MTKISASLIVKNEEECLEECLKSLSGIDEIVIVDTGSEDKTIEIARRYTPNVYHGDEFLWRDDFAFSRNQSLDRCTGDWILIIDADEVLEAGGIEKARRIISSAEKDVIYVDTVSASNHTEVHKSIRLLKNHTARWHGRIHNYLSISEGDTCDLKVYYGYSSAHKKDPDRAFRILKDTVLKGEGGPREKFYLAREYWYRDDYVSAIAWYDEYLKVAHFGPEITEAWLVKARCLWHLRRGEEARDACAKCISLNTNFKEALLFMAEMSGPGNSKRWKQFAETATNEGVLFVRTSTEANMPSSRPNHIGWLCQKVLDLKPRSILDVGMGSGTKGVLFREYTDRWNLRYHKKDWKTIIDGIEIFPEYINNLHTSIYDRIHIGNALNLLDSTGHYDLIYAGDILEHFDKEDGARFLEKINMWGKTVIVATPVVASPQGMVLGNPYEEHKSQWDSKTLPGAQILTFGNTLVATFNNHNKYVYYCDSMRLFGEKMESLFGFEKAIVPGKPIFFVGLYFDEDYDVFLNHTGPKTVFWNGSDVTRMLSNKKWTDIVRQTKAIHFCHNVQLQSELALASVVATVSTLFFGDPSQYSMSYTDSVPTEAYIVAHPGREAEYGVPAAIEMTKAVENCVLNVFGITGNSTNKVKYHGWVSEPEFDTMVRKFHVCFRLNKHDGISQTVMKARMLGHTVISSERDVPFLVSPPDMGYRNEKRKEMMDVIRTSHRNLFNIVL